MKNKLFIIIAILLIWYINIDVVIAGSDTSDPYETCEEGKEYYNFYLFSEYLNTTYQAYPTAKFAQPYDYFAKSDWLYKFESYGAIPVNTTSSGTSISAGGTSATLGQWSVDDWWSKMTMVYDQGQSSRNSIQKRSGNTIVRFIVASNSSGNAYLCPQATKTAGLCNPTKPECTSQTPDALKTQYNSVNYKSGFGTLYRGNDPKNFVAIPPTTWIVYTYTGNTYGNPKTNAYDIFKDSDYYSNSNGFYGKDDKAKKFKIFRNYSCYKPLNSCVNSPCSSLTIKNRNSAYIPAVFYIKYTCRKPCNPTVECCYDSNGDYHDDYEGSSVYHFKYTIPQTEAQGKKGSTYSQRKTCGCDPTEACCYDSSGNLHREYNPNNIPGRTYQQSYRYVKNYGLSNETYPTVDNGQSGVTLKSQGYEKVSCGCEPKKKCCFDASGNYNYNSGSYVQVNPNDENSRQVVSCSCNGQKNGANCGETETYDEVKGNSGSGNNVTNDFTCTMKGQYTNSGFSMLTGSYGTSYTAIAPGYDVVCKDSYEVQYPDDQRESTDNLGRYFTFKSRNIGVSLAKIKVTRNCVSSRLSDSTMRTGAANAILGSYSRLRTGSMSAYIWYEDIKDIYELRTATNPKLDLITSGTGPTTTYYYTTSDSIPSTWTFGSTFESSTKDRVKNSNAYYISSVSTVSYDAVLPPLYLRGSQGDTTKTFSHDGQAKLPNNSLPIMLTTKGNLSRNYTVTLKLGDMLSRPSGTYTSKRPNNMVKDLSANTTISKTCKYTTQTKIKIGGKSDKFIYRTVSLSNINPTNRTLGENWNSNNRNLGVYGTLSVAEKKTKIDAHRANLLLDNSVSNDYSLKRTDDNYDRLAKGHEHFTFEITPDTMRMIRNYNSIRRSVGGYDDWDLEIMDYKDTDDAGTIFRNRYVKQTSYYCGWHWYSPFLSRLSGYMLYTEPVANCGKSINARSRDALNSAFSGFQKEERTMTNSELNENRKKLIKKQNQLDNQAYRNAGGS